MITNLENLLNSELFAELTNAIAGNKDFSFCKDGLQILSKPTDNGLELTLHFDSTVSERHQLEKERSEFINFVNSLDDNLFIELVETMGAELTNKLQNMINGDNLESARAAIIKFKSEYKQLLSNKINYYQECLRKLDK